jgi:hypothetical protein
LTAARSGEHDPANEEIKVKEYASTRDAVKAAIKT